MFTSPVPAGETAVSNPPPSSRTSNPSPSPCVREIVMYRGARGVLGCVLHRLEAAEVHGALHLGGVAPGAVGIHARLNRHAAGSRPQRLHEPLVLQQRRVDPVSQGADRVQRVLHLVAERMQLLPRPRRDRSPGSPPSARGGSAAPRAAAGRRRGGRARCAGVRHSRTRGCASATRGPHASMPRPWPSGACSRTPPARRRRPPPRSRGPRPAPRRG